MDLMSTIGGIIQQYANPDQKHDRAQSRNDFDQISNVVPKDMLGSLIGPALASLGNREVQERVYNSATEMSPQQRGGLLGSLLGGLGSSGIDLSSLLGRLGVNPRVADAPEEASPEDVAKVAAYAQKENPSIFDRAMEFYAEHPMLVKILGTMAIAAIARRLGNSVGRGSAELPGGNVFGKGGVFG